MEFHAVQLALTCRSWGKSSRAAESSFLHHVQISKSTRTTDSAEERKAIASLAGIYDVYIVEDDLHKISSQYTARIRAINGSVNRHNGEGAVALSGVDSGIFIQEGR